MLQFGYYVKKIGNIIPCILEKNCPSLIKYTKYPHFHLEAIKTVVLTTKQFYQSQVADLFTSAFFIGWSQVCINEAHINMNAESGILKLVHGIEKRFWKWMVTETLFESMLSQMASWIAILEQGWVKPDLLDCWELCKKYQGQLQHCRTVEIGKIRKTHSALVKHKETNKKIIDKHVANLAVVLQALWLRKNAKTSRFFDHALVKILLNHYQVIKYTPPKSSTALSTT